MTFLDRWWLELLEMDVEARNPNLTIREDQCRSLLDACGVQRDPAAAIQEAQRRLAKSPAKYVTTKDGSRLPATLDLGPTASSSLDLDGIQPKPSPSRIVDRPKSSAPYDSGVDRAMLSEPPKRNRRW